MALDKNKLKDSLLYILQAGTSPAATPCDPLTAEQAAQKWVDAYADYAADAKGLTFSPTITDLSKSTMKSVLQGYFEAVLVATASGAASAIATALTAFWLVPPVAFPPTVLVTAVGGTSSLTSDLLGVFGSRAGSADDKADQLATAIDTFTKTVTVTNSVGGATGNLL